MTRPTPAEVTAYAAGIGFRLDGEEFCDFYAAKGWKIGTTPMKDWQAAVRTWKRRQGPSAKVDPNQAKWERLKRARAEEEKIIDDYARQLDAIRSWRGHPGHPDESIAADEDLLMRRIKDSMGPSYCARVRARCGEQRKEQRL